MNVDISKVFDSVSWSFLLELLRYIGFPQRWPVPKLMSMGGRTVVFPTRAMLFVIVMEVLNSFIVVLAVARHSHTASRFAICR
jgi:hypothetical protein